MQSLILRHDVAPGNRWPRSLSYGVGRSQRPPSQPLQYTRVVLPNGLVAMFNEDHASPIVAVGVGYHIGAKDERTAHRTRASL